MKYLLLVLILLLPACATNLPINLPVVRSTCYPVEGVKGKNSLYACEGDTVSDGCVYSFEKRVWLCDFEQFTF